MKKVRRVGIVDADLIGRDKHRFPNLVCEKLSAFWKERGAVVELITQIDQCVFEQFDRIYISKVFTDTEVPEWLVEKTRINGKDFARVSFKLGNTRCKIGGTGFFFDKAPDLPCKIEHHMPDYTLYDAWIKSEVENARAEYERQGRNFNERSYCVQFKEYTDYSIGFVTRGCFRKCPFCVNQKYSKVFKHSPLAEFYDPSRRKLCFLDDNFLGYGNGWRAILDEILKLNRPFKFKQGLDERLLTDDMCKMVFNASYDGDYTFAFDKIADYDLIERKLKMIRRHTHTTSIRFYVLCGFESTDERDIEITFRRIALLMRFKCLPYIMRYQSKNDAPWKQSEFRSLYVSIARWCNQPNFFKKKSFREFCVANQELVKTEGKLCASMQALTDFEKRFPKIAAEYFDLHYSDYKLEGEE